MFSKLKLSAKISLLAAVLLVITTILGVVVSVNMFSAGRTSNFISDEIVPSLGVSIPMLASIDDFSENFLAYQYTSDTEYVENARESIAALEKELDSARKLLRTATSLPTLESSVRILEPLTRALHSNMDTMSVLGKRQREARNVLGPLGPEIVSDVAAFRRTMDADTRGQSSQADKDLAFYILAFNSNVVIAVNAFMQNNDTTGMAALLRTASDLTLCNQLHNSPTLSREFKDGVAGLIAKRQRYIAALDTFLRTQAARNAITQRVQTDLAEYLKTVDNLLDATKGRAAIETKSAADTLDLSIVITFVLLIIALVLCVFAVSQVHSFGLGAQVNFYTGEMFAPGLSLLVSPTDKFHVAINWYNEITKLKNDDPDLKNNIVGLTFDFCPFSFRLAGSDALSFNLTLGIGLYTNLHFHVPEKAKLDLKTTGGLRIPVGVNLFFGNNLEIFTHVAPSFGINFLEPFEKPEKPFFPVAVGARVWFR